MAGLGDLKGPCLGTFEEVVLGRSGSLLFRVSHSKGTVSDIVVLSAVFICKVRHFKGTVSK